MKKTAMFVVLVMMLSMFSSLTASAMVEYEKIWYCYLDTTDSSISTVLYAKSDEDLSIEVEVYADGEYEDSFSTSEWGREILWAIPYDFDSDIDYRIVAAFEAGGESKTLITHVTL